MTLPVVMFALLCGTLIFCVGLASRLAAGDGPYPASNSALSAQSGISGYALLCREQLRSRRRLPVRLSALFSQDAPEQYTPPGWPVLLALLPDRIVLRRSPWIVPVLGAVACVALFCALFWAGLAVGAAFAAALWPALAPLGDYGGEAARPVERAADLGQTALGQTTLGQTGPGLPGYDAPPALAALLGLLVVLPACAAAVSGQWWPWLVSLFAGCLLLFTSVSGTIACFCGLLCAGAFTGLWELLLVIPLLLVLCTVASAGFYARLSRNRLRLARCGLGGGRWRGDWAKTPGNRALPQAIGRILGRLCLEHFDLLAPVALLCLGAARPALYGLFFSGALALELTLLLAPLAFFGLGCGVLAIALRGWGKMPHLALNMRVFSVLGTAPCLAALWTIPGPEGLLPAFVISLAGCWRGLHLLARLPQAQQDVKAAESAARAARHVLSAEAAFRALSEIRPEHLLALPLNLADTVAWRSRVRVFWGGHSGTPEAVLARLSEHPGPAQEPDRLAELCREYGISHIFADMSLLGGQGPATELSAASAEVTDSGPSSSLSGPTSAEALAAVPPLFAAGEFRIWSADELLRNVEFQAAAARAAALRSPLAVTALVEDAPGNMPETSAQEIPVLESEVPAQAEIQTEVQSMELPEVMEAHSVWNGLSQQNDFSGQGELREETDNGPDMLFPDRRSPDQLFLEEPGPEDDQASK